MISVNKKLAFVAEILTFLGCLVGLVGAGGKIYNNEAGILGYVFLSIPFFYFLSGTIIAANLIFNIEKSRRLFIWFWSSQIPVLKSSYLSFHAVTGAVCVFWIRLDELDIGIGFGIAIKFQFDLMVEGPTAIGINIFALAMTLFMNAGFLEREK